MRPLFTKVLSAALAASTLSAYSPLVSAENARDTKVVFEDDFEAGDSKWEFLDPETWKHNPAEGKSGNASIEITDRKSEYSPPTRSPGHVALVKNLEVGSCEIQFRVKSTLDTGNHRDCCVFFGYQDSAHFYYVHLGAKPDPHSGQIMIVNDAPRLALTTNEKLTPWDNDWHNVLLRRDVESGTIEIFFDDMETPHMSVVDKTFGKGRVGLGSFDDLNAFDDVVIRELH
ncbi:hypothetical protein [Rhodopirellula halodulae]|uniref:hypothetical protein n=1 Tax=Rhodopirellula halodulae TaxID=2894198 RepID=UPI001E383AD0|nr:hypothetical protein [Rhodopirellula sp. JC737]MCC9655646.1 hypothetical protein [Rhodopirellula sp. JC737]